MFRLNEAVSPLSSARPFSVCPHSFCPGVPKRTQHSSTPLWVLSQRKNYSPSGWFWGSQGLKQPPGYSSSLQHHTTDFPFSLLFTITHFHKAASQSVLSLPTTCWVIPVPGAGLCTCVCELQEASAWQLLQLLTVPLHGRSALLSISVFF